MVKLYYRLNKWGLMHAFKTQYDQILHLMGGYGITSSNSMLSKDLVLDLSNELDKAPNTIRASFTKLKKASLIEKVKNEDEISYQFTNLGFDKFKELDTLINNYEESEETDTTISFSKWLKIYYPDIITTFHDLVDSGISYIEISFDDIGYYNREWEELLIKTPDVIIPLIKDGVYKYLEPHFIDDHKEMLDKLEIHIINIPDYYITQVENIDTSYIGQFVAIEGRITEQSKIEAKVKEAVFKCLRCEDELTIYQPFTGKFIEPVYCQNETCEKKGPFSLLEDRTKWINGQTVVLSSMKQSNRIKTIRCFLEGDICKSADQRDGKKAIVTGTLINIQKLDKTRSKTVSFEFGIKVNNIYLVQDSLTSFPTDDECDVFDEWVESKKQNGLSIIHDKIISSVAPSVFGMWFEKDVTSLPLFSDWTWELTNQDMERSSLHVLLLGDSGTAKSKIMKDILNISPRGLNEYTYKSAIQSTAVGLTSIVDKSDIDGKWTLRAGFLASADKGVVGIDEIDKMNQNDLGTIAPVLEDQRQDVAKAASGLFYSRCAVIMTANPDGGKINTYEPLIDQFSTAIFFRQRIDIILGVPDSPEPEWDYNVGNRILENHQRTLELCNKVNKKLIDVHSDERDINIDMLRKYIMYARSKPVPIMSNEAMSELNKMYVSKRKDASNGVAPRMLSSLIRVSIAIARRELARSVEIHHAHEAIKLIDQGLRSITNSDGFGNVDYSVLEYGQSHSQRDKIKIVKDIIKQSGEHDEIIKQAEILGIDGDSVDSIINKLRRSGQIMMHTNGSFNIV